MVYFQSSSPRFSIISFNKISSFHSFSYPFIAWTSRYSTFSLSWNSPIEYFLQQNRYPLASLLSIHFQDSYTIFHQWLTLLPKSLYQMFKLLAYSSWITANTYLSTLIISNVSQKQENAMVLTLLLGQWKPSIHFLSWKFFFC